MNAQDTPVPAHCIVPPAGWYCTREPGHSGPCAAVPNRPAETPIPAAPTIPAYTKAWIRERAQDAGFIVNPMGQVVVPAPECDALPYLRRLLGQVQASQVSPSMALPSKNHQALGQWISGTFPPDNRQVVVELQGKANGRAVYEVARYYRTEPGVHEGPPAWADNHGNVLAIRRWKFINS